MMKKHYLKKILLIAGSVFTITNFALAQQVAIDSEFRSETIEMVLQMLLDKYAYPEIAVKMTENIRARAGRGEYESINDGARLAAKITSDLRTVFDDKHLRLSYSEQKISAQSSKAGLPSAEEIEQARRRQTRENFGLQKVEILKGNVGLMQINYFAPLDWSAEVYSAAFNAVANTDALIIDLRHNRGSMDLNTMPYFCSYLFDKPVLFGDMFSREKNETIQLWTYAYVPGKKYIDKPIFILTGNRTASGAEAFVSRLRKLKRATSIGEATAGASMPGRSYRVNEHFSIWISDGRSSTGSAANENKGVPPDIETLPEKALNTAYLQALNLLLQKTTDEDWKAKLKLLITDLNLEKESDSTY